MFFYNTYKNKIFYLNTYTYSYMSVLAQTYLNLTKQNYYYYWLMQTFLDLTTLPFIF